MVRIRWRAVIAASILAGAVSAQELGAGPSYAENTWPTALIDRPLLLPHNTFEVQPGFAVGSDNFASLGLAFGFTSRFEIDLAGAVCVSSSCPGLRQTADAAIAYAFIAEPETNLVSAFRLGVDHALRGSSYGPALISAFTQRFGQSFQLLVAAGASYTTAGSNGVIAQFSDYQVGFSGRLEPRFQLSRDVAIAPFVSAEVRLNGGPSAYAVPLGIRGLISPTTRFDFGLEMRASDLTDSSTLVRSGFDVAGFVAIRI